jgi:hypothetical protein
LCLLPGACKRDHQTPAPVASAPSPLDSTSEAARQTRFDSELKRAQARWQEHPDLGNCAEILKEKADAELCRTASSALTALEQASPTSPPEATLPLLADASLALVRLFERARYLSLEDIGHARLQGEAGAPTRAAASAHVGVPAAPSVSTPAQRLPRALHSVLRERSTLKLTESPTTRLVQSVARLEREVLRHFGAYLEYAPLPIRQSAYASAKTLQTEHPHWPGLNHLLREAAVLETDATLKQNLNELASLGLPQGKSPDQPTGSK